MKRILITGSAGQIGSELTLALRGKYGSGNVVAGLHLTAPSLELRDSGPYVFCDCLEPDTVAETIKRYRIDTIFHLAAMLSLRGEENPEAAWRVNVGTLANVLEVANTYRCAVFFPSSIGAFGPTAPRHLTPQETVQRPQTMYGVTKVSGELLCDYYQLRYGVDARGLRFPGIISHKTLPGGGTTDYAVEIFIAALTKASYTCYLKPGTYLDMMYMPDAVSAAIELMEADPEKLRYRNAYNVTAMSLEPEMIAGEIRKFLPSFRMDYSVDPMRQRIADSWPDRLDDGTARLDWGWNPRYDLAAMTRDMLDALENKLAKK